MTISRSLALLLLAGSLVLAVPAVAQVNRELLRPEWSVEPARAGRARVAGYVYNSSIFDAANVWLRVEQVGPDGSPGDVYRRRLIGDVLSGGRLAFDVPVSRVDTSYRVLVETVDWVKECR